MDAFVFLCQLFVGGIMLMSGAIKAFDIREFVVSIHKYETLPKALERPAAFVITATELGSAVLLLSGEAARVGAGLAAGLLVVFIVAVARNVIRKVDIECGCFGLLWREKTGWPTIARDLVLLAAAAVVLAAGAGVTLRNALDGPDGFFDVLPVVAVAAVTIAAAWVARVAYRANASFNAAAPAPENLPPPVVT